MSTCLVTGASGFIGHALTHKLVHDGWGVRAAVRRPEKAFAPGVNVIQGLDLLADVDWRPVLEQTDVVVHAAARAHLLREPAVDPLAKFRAVNVTGTMNLACRAVAAGVRRFVFISTVGVNGSETFGRPFSADDPATPASPYAVSKHEAEKALLALSASSGMEVVVIRPPLVYGPGAPGNFGMLTSWLSRGLPLPLANVNNLRSLIGLDNLLDLICIGMIHPMAANRIFMASDGQDLSTPEFLRRFGAALGCPARMFSMPQSVLQVAATMLGRPGLTTQLCGSLQVNIQATRDRLEWKPPFSVDQGLARAAEGGIPKF
jgi:nucleoside-diphosphate-sugar epimerase